MGEREVEKKVEKTTHVGDAELADNVSVTRTESIDAKADLSKANPFDETRTETVTRTETSEE